MSKNIDIINLYLGGYNNFYSGREIARRAKINHQTALNRLNILVRDKILLAKKEGRNKNYFINTGSIFGKFYLQLAENYRSLRALDKFELKKVIESLLPLAETVIIFGSFAKGLEKPDSDIDVVAINASNKELIRKKLRILSREVNIEFISWKDFEKVDMEKTALANEIRSNHLIYGNVYKVINIYCS